MIDFISYVAFFSFYCRYFRRVIRENRYITQCFRRRPSSKIFDCQRLQHKIHKYIYKFVYIYIRLNNDYIVCRQTGSRIFLKILLTSSQISTNENNSYRLITYLRHYVVSQLVSLKFLLPY